MTLKGPVSVNSSGSTLLNSGRFSASCRRALRTSPSGHGSASFSSGFFFGAAGFCWAPGSCAVAQTNVTTAIDARRKAMRPTLLAKMVRIWGPILASRRAISREFLAAFVGARAVNGGDRHVVQTQVDTELTTMVDDVVQDKASKRCHARRGEQFLAAALQRPRRRQLGVGLIEQGARSPNLFVEVGHHRRARRQRVAVGRHRDEIDR